MDGCQQVILDFELWKWVRLKMLALCAMLDLIENEVSALCAMLSVALAVYKVVTHIL